MAKLKMAITFLILMLGILLLSNLNIWLNCSELKLKWVACGKRSYDPRDFLGRLIGDKPWVRNAERSMFECYDNNFYASTNMLICI